ncbi:MAG: TonB-dependent receptor [Cryomorphaceae bacterium]|nr:TonB-dependent receptor [Cryomorphaceae bacterium]
MKHLLCSIAITLVGTSVLAQENLRSVEVIGVDENNKHYRESPRQVIVIERADIESSGAQSITEILEYAIGVDVRQRGPMDAQTDISMRGGTFDQTLILIDGVRANDPQTGHHNMNLPIHYRQIERIEIIPGGASRLLGQGAMTGAINIITKKDPGNRGSLESFFGQNGLFGGRIYQQFGGENYGFAVNAQHIQHTGFMNNTDFTSSTINLTGYQKGSNHELNALVGLTSRAFGAQNFYSFAFPEQFEAIRGLQAHVNFRRNIDKNTVFEARAYARQHHDRFELFREGIGHYQFQNGLFISDTDTAPSWYGDHNYHRSRVAGAETTLRKTFAKYHTVSVGVDYRYESILSNALGEPMEDEISVRHHPRGAYTRFADRHNLAAHTEYRFSMHRFTFQGGVLFNENTDFGSAIMPGAEMSYAFSKNNMIFGGYNRGFRMPTYTDLYYAVGGAQGSIDLQPEYSDQVEVGYRHLGKKYTINSAVFYREGRDLIDWVRFPGDDIVYATNIQALNIYGIETDFRWRFGTAQPVEQMLISYSYQDSPEEDFAFESVYALDFLRNKLNIGLQGLLFGDLRYNARVSWQDRRGEFSNINGELQSYPHIWMSALRLSYERGKGSSTAIDYYVEASNLFNQQPVFDRGGIVLPGLWVRGGVIVSFE